MSLTEQRLILIALYLLFFASYQGYARYNPTFSCEALHANPIHDLNFNGFTDTTSKSRFLLWVDMHYGRRAVDEGRYVVWEKERIGYRVDFGQGELASIEVITYAFKTDVQDFISCFGQPSATSTIAVRNGDEGMLNLNSIWYDDLRLFMMGTAPTQAAEGTLSLLDEDAEIRSFFIYSPTAYEREKH